MASIDKEIKSKFENDHQRAVVNILYTANWIKNIHMDALKPFNISAQQYNILRILRGGADWMAMTDVKDRMIEKSPNTTRLADKLLDSKLLERRRSSADRRVVYVKITDKGLKLLKDIDTEKAMTAQDSIAKNISKKEAKKLSGIIDKLRTGEEL
jgi:DNA-binding MarR family transcriptional regulator